LVVTSCADLTGCTLFYFRVFELRRTNRAGTIPASTAVWRFISGWERVLPSTR